MIRRSMRTGAAASLMTLAWLVSGACFVEGSTFDPPEVEQEEEEEEEECRFRPWKPEASGPACGEDEEAALAQFWRSSPGGSGPGLRELHGLPLGEISGEVVEVDGQTITLDFGGDDVRTFSWLRDLPFAVAVGQVVRVETGYATTALTFPGGSLWAYSEFAFSGPSEPSFGVGPLEVKAEWGCQSSWGRSVVPIVVTSDGREVPVPPGGQVEVDAWTFHNHGATLDEGWVDCNMIVEGTYRGLWTAEYRDCSFDLPPTLGPSCTQEVEAEVSKLWDALDSGLTLLHRNPPGEKIGEVVQVEGRTLSLDFGADDLRTFTWLTDLPFPIVVGQEVRAETTFAASTFTLPSGSLWVHAQSGFSGPDEEVFEVGPLRISHGPGCRTRFGDTVDPIVVAPSGKAIRVLPGEQVEVEGWTFHNHGAFSSPGQMKCDMILEGQYLGFWTAAHVAPAEDGSSSTD